MRDIAKISGSIDDALKGQYKEELERRKEGKQLARLRRRRRENFLRVEESIDSASGVLSGVGKAFNIMDFIKNILLGGLLCSY